MLSLELGFDTDDDGSLIIETILTNTGDDPVTFSTGSGRLFDVSVERPDGEHIWTDSALSTQAVERWSLDPGESLARGHTWEHPSVYERIAERHEESHAEYCEKFGIEDWQAYAGETLIAVVKSLGPDDAPVETFTFTVSESLPQEEAVRSGD